MKPAPGQNLLKLKPLSPRFSGVLPTSSVLSIPPRGEEYRFTDEDRKAVEGTLGLLEQPLYHVS